MRAVVTNYAGVAPVINVGAEPASDGSGVEELIGWAEMHFVDPGTATPIAVPATFVKAANVSTLIDGTANIGMTADNRLENVGDEVIPVLVLATLSFKCAANNQVLAFAFAVDGAVHVPSIVRTKIGTGTDIQAVTITIQVDLAPGDYVEVWVSNDTGANNITIEHGVVELRS